jgi:hypothetical protein
MQVIQHQELASAQTSIVFNSIPQTFSDLYVVFSLRSDSSSNGNCGIQFNTLATNQSGTALYGTGSGTGSFAISTSGNQNIFAYISDSSQTANTFGNGSFYIPNYTASVAKSVSVDGVSENNATAAVISIMAGLWNSTAAITSLTLVPVSGSSNLPSGNFVQYSSATLYGITKGSDGTTTVS